MHSNLQLRNTGIIATVTGSWKETEGVVREIRREEREDKKEEDEKRGSKVAYKLLGETTD